MLASDHTPYRTPLILLGYWAGSGIADDWPDPADFIDLAWDEADRLDLGLYLQHGIVARAYMGYSACRICGVTNGRLELTDGVFVWPEGLGHYVRDHAVRLPAEFEEHAAHMGSLTEEIVIDDQWWRARGTATR